MRSSASVRVRAAESGEALDVRRILDAAMLEPGDVESRIADGDVLVAVADRPEAGDRVLGALVLAAEPPETSVGIHEVAVSSDRRSAASHVAAIAVRRRRRDRGIGTALIEAALDREGRLTAHFDADLRPFYEALGFDVCEIGDGRFAGRRER
ncbi:GNAT family N-acetyltransferase [Halovivax sp.]|uniref:GNAT family N-acetyltransferase n=1 Tax=Halovivax sp. TaxID=1935978 RepID=UPI0025BC58E4|nr:GNAT family N-acetyltransferase [Halovivax sp.]